MMNLLRKYRYQIFLFTIIFFLLGTFIGFGGYLFGPQGSGDAIAEVDGEKIPLRIFYSHYRRALDQAGPRAQDAAARQQFRDETVRDLVQGIVFAREAKAHGIQVTDQQVVTSLTQIPAFQDKGTFNPQLYMQALQSQIRMTPQDFEDEQRKSIAFFKLRWLIQSAIKVTDAEARLLAGFRTPNKPLKTAKEMEEFRQQIWQEKVLYSFNQWFNQIGRDLKVKTHFELIEGTR